ncbi:uncharacterized protein LOC131874084 [Cryptomeria japonica]|uniref:uncharacterized protein LOC131874084 n=1 Tax=Cryptomeria japonica TaxID=3369 RepID=UPI0027D9D603|nr:uncharacterized protein LOC131874084 [Cryptomeria japonica]
MIETGTPLEGKYSGYNLEENGLLLHLGWIYRVKAEHQRSAGLLQTNLVPDWKWDIISVVDGLTKVSHFVPIRSSYIAPVVARVFMKDVVRLHGIPRRIISDRDLVFTSTL